MPLAQVIMCLAPEIAAKRVSSSSHFLAARSMPDLSTAVAASTSAGERPVDMKGTGALETGAPPETARLAAGFWDDAGREEAVAVLKSDSFPEGAGTGTIGLRSPDGWQRSRSGRRPDWDVFGTRRTSDRGLRAAHRNGRGESPGVSCFR